MSFKKTERRKKLPWVVSAETAENRTNIKFIERDLFITKKKKVASYFEENSHLYNWFKYSIPILKLYIFTQ